MAVNSFLRIIREPGLDFSLVKKKMCLCVRARVHVRVWTGSALVPQRACGGPQLWVFTYLPSLLVTMPLHCKNTRPASLQVCKATSLSPVPSPWWSAGITGALWAPDFLWIWGSELGSPWLQCNCLTHWAIPQPWSFFSNLPFPLSQVLMLLVVFYCRPLSSSGPDIGRLCPSPEV